MVQRKLYVMYNYHSINVNVVNILFNILSVSIIL